MHEAAVQRSDGTEARVQELRSSEKAGLRKLGERKISIETNILVGKKEESEPMGGASALRGVLGPNDTVYPNKSGFRRSLGFSSLEEPQTLLL